MNQEQKLEIAVTGRVGESVPDYVTLAEKWHDHWVRTGANHARMYSLHYRQVAEELGQCVILRSGAARRVAGAA